MPLDAPPIVYQDRFVTLYHGKNTDVIAWLVQQGQHDDKGYLGDALITDPPYSPSTQEGSRAQAGKGAEEKVRKRTIGFAPFTPARAKRALRWMAHLARNWSLIFSDDDLAYHYRVEGERQGLEYMRQGEWVKTLYTPQFNGICPAQATEYIQIFRRGTLRWNGGGFPAVYLHPREDDPEHPTIKPLNLMLEIVRDFTNEGDLILDPFAGTGKTLLAARMMGRRAIGIEQNKAICKRAWRDLRQPTLPFFEPCVKRTFASEELERHFARFAVELPKKDDFVTPAKPASRVDLSATATAPF